MNAFDTGSRLGAVVVLAGAVLLAGCASGSASVAKRGDGYRHTDAVYVSTVEELAKRRGVRVVWVHPPYKDARQVK
jgi:hypothetical protein